MRRVGVVACVLACFALPAAGRAATPPAYAPIGPPATLNTFVFGTDGTVYATVDTASTAVRPEPQGALWRSGDGGRTWSSRYRARSGARFVVLAVSPADANAVYASETLPQAAGGDRAHRRRHRTRDPAADDAPAGPRRGGNGLRRRAPDWCAARAAPTPAMRCRCPSFGQYSDRRPEVGRACSSRTLVQRHGGRLHPDEHGRRGDLDAGRPALARSTSASATPPVPWRSPARSRARCTGLSGEIVVSHDAGLTWSQQTPRPINGGLIVGSSPAVVLFNNGPTMLFTSDGVSFRSVNIPSPVWPSTPSTPTTSSSRATTSRAPTPTASRGTAGNRGATCSTSASECSRSATPRWRERARTSTRRSATRSGRPTTRAQRGGGPRWPWARTSTASSSPATTR